MFQGPLPILHVLFQGPLGERAVRTDRQGGERWTALSPLLDAHVRQRDRLTQRLCQAGRHGLHYLHHFIIAFSRKLFV